MGEEPESSGAGTYVERSPARKWIALGLLAALAGLAWKTIDPGKLRTVVLVLLLVFGLRVVLAASASR